jgi:hypothetical protein
MAEGDATISMYVDPTDMLRWTHSVDGIERKVNAAIADGLNHYGEMVVRNWAEELAESSGLEPGAVLRLIVVKPARSNKHVFTADASAIKNANPQWMRPWTERDHAEFEQDTLVKIVTSHDESTCEVCLEAERNGPYTLRQIKDMAAKWGHFQGKGGKGEATNLLHPNCRCVYQPFTAVRRLPVSVGTSVASKVQMTARQLGEVIAGELKMKLKVTK